jgi:hypothetical protein
MHFLIKLTSLGHFREDILQVYFGTSIAEYAEEGQTRGARLGLS